MKTAEFNRRLPALLARYDAVALLLDRPLTRRGRKVSHRAVLDEFLSTRSYSQTARAFDISKNAVWLIVYRAIRMAEDMADPSSIPEMRRKRSLKANPETE